VVLRSLFGLGFARPLRFSPSRGAREVFSSLAVLSQPFAPLQSLTTLWPLPVDITRPDNFLPCGLSPLRRFPGNGQLPTPRVYHTRGYDTFSAFLTLSRLSSAQILPALFHAGPVLGVSPSGPYCTPRAFRPLGRGTLLWFTPSAATILTPPRSRPLGFDPGRSNDQS
jgi:hypothetical protein